MLQGRTLFTNSRAWPAIAASTSSVARSCSAEWCGFRIRHQDIDHIERNGVLEPRWQTHRARQIAVDFDNQQSIRVTSSSPEELGDGVAPKWSDKVDVPVVARRSRLEPP